MRYVVIIFVLNFSLSCSPQTSAPKYRGHDRIHSGDQNQEAPGERQPPDEGSQPGASGPGAEEVTNPSTPPSSDPGPGSPAAGGPSSGSVSISLTLSPPTPAGPYRNRGHIRSLWITDANNSYVRTLHAFAATRAVHLKRWFRFTNNVIDGASGATQTTPAAGIPITVSWDLKDKAGNQTKTGNYKLWLEFSEANTPALDQGKTPAELMQAIDAINGYEFHVIPFSISAQETSKSDTSNPVFRDVMISHKP